MAEDRFREDLLYRLNVVEIHLPALRERKQDVAPLARHFLALACVGNDMAERRLAPEAEAYLAAQPFPGNVRQLRNLMERLAILANGDPIPRDEVERLLAPKRKNTHSDAFTECATFEEFKQVSERAFLVSKLEENGWNIKRTAEQLSMMRSNLYKKINKYGLK